MIIKLGGLSTAMSLRFVHLMHEPLSMSSFLTTWRRSLIEPARSQAAGVVRRPIAHFDDKAA